ncbi:MAG: GNAT family N-acetyltransferase [Acetobacteraceae bacterium]
MIVRAVPANAPAMAEIHAKVFGGGAEANWGSAWGADAFAVQLLLPGALGLLDVAGGLLLARVLGPEAEVLTFGVVPRARRQGIGSALLAAAMAAAAAAGAERMLLEVGAANEAARSLYEKAEFVRIGERRAYYADRTDALLLAADLPARTERLFRTDP